MIYVTKPMPEDILLRRVMWRGVGIACRETVGSMG